MDAEAKRLTVEDLDPSERQPAEVWTRVMGYHRPVSAFNPGKQAEHRERQAFVERPLPDNADDEWRRKIHAEWNGDDVDQR